MSQLSELLDRVSTLLGRFSLRHFQWVNIVTGDVDGGPNGDGYYPFSDTNDTTVLVPSMKLIETIAGAPGVPEAPMDGKAYIRRNGAWVAFTIQDNGGVDPEFPPEAPMKFVGNEITEYTAPGTRGQKFKVIGPIPRKFWNTQLGSLDGEPEWIRLEARENERRPEDLDHPVDRVGLDGYINTVDSDSTTTIEFSFIRGPNTASTGYQWLNFFEYRTLLYAGDFGTAGFLAMFLERSTGYFVIHDKTPTFNEDGVLINTTTGVLHAVPAFPEWERQEFKVVVKEGTSDGFIQIWQNGIQIVNKVGQVGYQRPAYMQFRIYRGTRPETAITFTKIKSIESVSPFVPWVDIADTFPGVKLPSIYKLVKAGTGTSKVTVGNNVLKIESGSTPGEASRIVRRIVGAVNNGIVRYRVEIDYTATQNGKVAALARIVPDGTGTIAPMPVPGGDPEMIEVGLTSASPTAMAVLEFTVPPEVRAPHLHFEGPSGENRAVSIRAIRIIDVSNTPASAIRNSSGGYVRNASGGFVLR
ncbi:hypothetical protein [Sphingobium sp.]|uniref:hypothetical protein n=1 Tax=Sphingobium sp. TaxID=1912891 RepID=UPI003BB597DC